MLLRKPSKEIKIEDDCILKVSNSYFDKIYKRFSIFPTFLSDGSIIWFEYFYSFYIFKMNEFDKLDVKEYKVNENEIEKYKNLLVDRIIY